MKTKTLLGTSPATLTANNNATAKKFKQNSLCKYLTKTESTLTLDRCYDP